MAKTREQITEELLCEPPPVKDEFTELFDALAWEECERGRAYVEREVQRLVGKISMRSDPVFKSPRGWFFWDETWSGAFGPFATEGEARIALGKYVDEFLS